MKNYDQIFLSDQDIDILNKLVSGQVLCLHCVEAQHLFELGFITKYALSKREDEYVVTADGELYYEYLRKKNSEKANSEKAEHNERVREWFAIIVSNLIALASLLIALSK